MNVTLSTNLPNLSLAPSLTDITNKPIVRHPTLSLLRFQNRQLVYIHPQALSRACQALDIIPRMSAERQNVLTLTTQRCWFSECSSICCGTHWRQRERETDRQIYPAVGATATCGYVKRLQTAGTGRLS